MKLKFMCLLLKNVIFTLHTAYQVPSLNWLITQGISSLHIYLLSLYYDHPSTHRSLKEKVGPVVTIWNIASQISLHIIHKFIATNITCECK